MLFCIFKKCDFWSFLYIINNTKPACCPSCLQTKKKKSLSKGTTMAAPCSDTAGSSEDFSSSKLFPTFSCFLKLCQLLFYQEMSIRKKGHWEGGDKVREESSTITHEISSDDETFFLSFCLSLFLSFFLSFCLSLKCALKGQTHHLSSPIISYFKKGRTCLN